MIQRIQSIYLLVAVVAGIVCLCLQIGTVDVDGLVVARMYNLWVTADGGVGGFTVWPLFAVLTLASAIGVYSIFMFGNRVLQARFCLFSALLTVGWYIIYAAFGFLMPDSAKGETFAPSFVAALPLVSLVFYLLARKAILADERLVRAADRIR